MRPYQLAKFVEYADVRAGAEVWVSDGIVQSKLVAELLTEAKQLAAQEEALAQKIPLLATRVTYFQEQATTARLNQGEGAYP